MTPSTAKAESLIRKLEEHLGFRLKGNSGLDTIRALKDSQGWPAIIMSAGGNEAANQPVCLVRIKGADAVSPDIFGNSFSAFAPHAVDVVFDDTALSHKDLAIVMHEVTKLASKTRVRQVTGGTAVTISSADSASIVASLEHELRWPTKSV
jgi:hypothetical protein